MTYKETLDYLYHQLPMYQRVGKQAFKKDLTNIRLLCKHLENPQNKFRSIHIAGTNGKGSTAHLLSAALQNLGLKVGLYTSPHYKDFRERIKINGTYISRKKVIDFVDKNKSSFDEIKPSFFEITVAMAFDFFAKEKVDIAIVETGLGGRLDSTNIITPLMSIITNISYDHQQFLGDTLKEIAGEKAGIIKASIPVVIGERQAETDHVFIQKAKAENASISFAEDHFRVQKIKSSNSQTYFDIYYQNQPYLTNLGVQLKGSFQQKNLQTVFESIRVFNQLNEFDALRKAQLYSAFLDLKNKTAYQGRWQVLQDKPLIIADSAHNEGGLKVVLQELTDLRYQNLHIILGVVNDKDLAKILPLFPENAAYYFAKADIPRGLNAKKLQTTAKKFNLKGSSYISIKNALKAAKRNASSEDLIFIGGSIFTVAEVL